MSVLQSFYSQYSLFVFHFCNQACINSEMSVLSLLQAMRLLTSGTYGLLLTNYDCLPINKLKEKKKKKCQTENFWG